jgi:hypothetical protein
VEPVEATIGDHLAARIVLQLPDGARFEPPEIGDTLGDLSVLRGRWAERPAEPESGSSLWTWEGTVAAYETGEVEVSPIRLRILREDVEEVVETEPLTVSILSVLPEADEEGAPEPADIKGPASIEPEYGALWAALGGLTALLAAAAAAWWLHRRFAGRLSSVAQPGDPFRRLPPHVWAYQELQKLLERDLGEERSIDRFYAELSRILKFYLTGRYRTDLMEHTTGEVPHLLEQAGAGEEAIAVIRSFLHRCDLVKFAGETPDPAACKGSVEEAYRIVDRTKPKEETDSSEERGAA